MNTPSSTTPSAQQTSSPFLSRETQLPLVALKGKRNGYIMLAPNQDITQYEHCPNELLLAAKAWAARLEQLGSPRAYWMIISEAVPHLHIHIFPRWPEDTLKGVALFETREQPGPHPAWSEPVEHALSQWAQAHQVAIL